MPLPAAASAAAPLLVLPLAHLEALYVAPEAITAWEQAVAAGDEHARSPLEPVSFGTATSGLYRIVPGGLAFAYIGPDAESAEAWTALQLSRQRTAPTPVETPPEGVEAAWSRGTDFYLVRDDNVGLMVQGTDDAAAGVQDLRALLEPAPGPWPAPPRLEPRGDLLVVDAPDAAHVSFRGGAPGPGPGLTFTEAPTRVTVWDRWGRAVVLAAAAPDEDPNNASPAPPAPPAPEQR